MLLTWFIFNFISHIHEDSRKDMEPWFVTFVLKSGKRGHSLLSILCQAHISFHISRALYPPAGASLVAQLVKNLPAMQETPVLFPGTGRFPGEGIGYPLQCSWASLVAETVKNPPAMWETWVWSLGWEGPLEEDMATHSSIFAWKIPMDRGAWGAIAHGVTKSRTRLSNSALHSTSPHLWNPRHLPHQLSSLQIHHFSLSPVFLSIIYYT